MQYYVRTHLKSLLWSIYGRSEMHTERRTLGGTEKIILRRSEVAFRKSKGKTRINEKKY